MPESGTSGSVGALGEKSPGATRPSKDVASHRYMPGCPPVRLA
jgi:hypothetical protein